MEMSSLSYANELYICLEICLSSRFMWIVLWPERTHFMPVLFQNACCGWGTWCNSLFWGISFLLFSSVQSLSRVQLFVTPWIAARQAPLSITNSQSSLKLTSIELVIPSSHLILCHPLLLLPPISPRIRVFSSESTLHMRWSKYWSFSFSIIPSKEHPRLISFRMDWLDLLAIQGTLKSLLQHHTSKASIRPCSAFFTVQLSYPYMTTGNKPPPTGRVWERLKGDTASLSTSQNPSC